MIEENKINKNKTIDALPIPEDAVILKTKNILDSSQLALLGIKEIIKQRGINLKVKKKRDLTELDCVFEINNFSIQVVYAGFTSDQIIIPLKRWYKINNAPQIILAANIDEESNIVFFKGIMTAKEFINIYLKKNAKGQSFEIPFSEFKGGINRLLSFVQILESEALSRKGISRNIDFLESLLKKSGLSRKNISIAIAAAGVIIFGPSIFRPRLLGNIASVPLSQIQITKYTRGINSEKSLNLCLVTPNVLFDKSTSTQIAKTSINKPLIFSPDPLNQISITKNGNLLWSRNASFNKKINEPIPWPIKPINPKEEYVLNIRPAGTVVGESANIILRAEPETSFKKLEKIIENLGDNPGDWSKEINKLIKQDSNAALALLFSDKAPQSKIINKARRLILEREGCL